MLLWINHHQQQTVLNNRWRKIFRALRNVPERRRGGITSTQSFLISFKFQKSQNKDLHIIFNI